MAKVDVRTRGEGETSYEAFPADTYFCEVQNAEIVASQFKDDKTGETKQQLKITWEVYQLTDEQEEAGLAVGKWFWQWLEPYYGPTKNGPSKFQGFVDGLAEQGLIPPFDPGDFDTDILIGKRQKVTVSYFEKDGQGRNKVLSVAPLRLRKPATRPSAPPPAGVTRKGAPPMRSAPPVAVEDEGDGEIPF